MDTSVDTGDAFIILTSVHYKQNASVLLLLYHGSH